jgi:polyhydroxybutyrate depolymerase
MVCMTSGHSARAIPGRRGSLRVTLAVGSVLTSLLPLACGDSGEEGPGGAGRQGGGNAGTGGALAGSGGIGASAGTSGQMGAAGQSGAGAQVGSGGQMGSSGQAGVSGQNGSGGEGGSGGAVGTAGTAGQGATGGSSGSGGSSGGGSGGSGGGGNDCSGKTLAPGDSNRTIRVGAASRSYILHVPSSYGGMTPAPLVLDFHALGGTGSSQRSSSGFGALSDRDGFVIAWPNGIDNAWNIGPCCTRSRDVDDLGFAKAIVAEVTSAGCIDSKRIYATGFSMGGGFSHFLACNAADVFAAVAPHAFDLLNESEEPCGPSRPISVLSFRGTADFVVPYAGGESRPPNGCCPPIHFLGAEGTLARWAQLNGCTGTPTVTGNTRLHMQCAAGVQVGLQTIQGGSHAPGPASAAWDFLKNKSRP